MHVFVVGSGGREHALVWKIAQSGAVRRLTCAPGNGGIAGEVLSATGRRVECVPMGSEDVEGLVAWAKTERPDLTVVGPDNPLAAGVVDRFQMHGLRIWGPNQKAAQFESSKAFAQGFMERHGIPAPRGAVFSSATEALGFAAQLGWACAVKADGLALGKGVVICRDERSVRAAITSFMVDKALGAAGMRVVVQELLEGVEISLHALCDGRTLKIFPTSQDHKRALDGNEGPNTGGMGAYSPTPFLTVAEFEKVGELVFGPWLEGCRREGIDFRGILYPGLMLTKSGPKVLEFNARFGDPEAQVYVRRLESDLVELLEASVDGMLDRVDVRWGREAVVCVVMASGGYPGAYEKGKRISGLGEAARVPGVQVFHAGTTWAGDGWVTSGGRVLGITAAAASVAGARDAAYDAVRLISFEGCHFRKDIASGGIA